MPSIAWSLPLCENKLIHVVQTSEDISSQGNLMYVPRKHSQDFFPIDMSHIYIISYYNYVKCYIWYIVSSSVTYLKKDIVKLEKVRTKVISGL